MNTTIKSLAMVVVALFAGFGSASAQEQEDEGVELTKDMFHVWDGFTKDAQPTEEKVIWIGLWVQRIQMRQVLLSLVHLQWLQPSMPTCLTIITW